MRRWVCAVGLFMVALCAGWASTASAAGTDVKWVTKPVPWHFKVAGSLFSGSTADTTFIQGKNDTTRTVAINTAAWAWDALTVGPAASAVQSIATLTLTAEVNNGASDSLYFHIEQGINGKYNHNVPGGSAFTPALGNSLVKVGNAHDGRIVFQGRVMSDGDAQSAIENLWLVPEFRIVVRGDGGTTPKLARCRLYITYPQRAASTP